MLTCSRHPDSRSVPQLEAGGASPGGSGQGADLGGWDGAQGPGELWGGRKEHGALARALPGPGQGQLGTEGRPDAHLLPEGTVGEAAASPRVSRGMADGGGTGVGPLGQCQAWVFFSSKLLVTPHS